MESRISLESDFSDEKQIYISTGLGGKGEKLRFYVLMTSKGKKPFQEYQRQTIEREFAYYLPKTDCEIERLTIGEQYVELVFLIPGTYGYKSHVGPGDQWNVTNTAISSRMFSRSRMSRN